MKNIITSCVSFVLILLALTTQARAQTLSQKRSVTIHISSYSDSTVDFVWSNFNIQSTEISRKTIESLNWTVIASNLTDTTYCDSGIIAGVEYEYQFKVATGLTPSEAYGYMAFGSKVLPKLNRGKILLAIDDRFSSSLQSSLKTLKQDLIGDGWEPISYSCNKDSSSRYVKRKIDSIRSVNTIDAVYLIGHVPVPYSGAIKPDGHGDHFGAWPTDLYYVSDSSLWTDMYYHFGNSTRPANSNYFGDGVFDNGMIPDDIECTISRIDFYNMPKLGNSEVQLLRNYLDQVSEYKHNKFSVADKGVIDNEIANYGEGFAVSAEMTFPSLVTDVSYSNNSLSNLTSTPAKWYMASSFGSDTSMYNIGSVSTLDTSDYQGVFSLLFGSYFGDWNTENNYMRGILADGKMLTSCWSGRPNWFFHHMGLNNPIGLSAQKSINNNRRGIFNSTAYQNAGNSSNGVHMALLGDLSLRDRYIDPVNSFTATLKSSYNDLSWVRTNNDDSLKFYIYSSQNPLNGYSLLQVLGAGSSTYIDYGGDSATSYYIKVVKLDSTLSGSYYNSSMGYFANARAVILNLPVELVSITAELVSTDDVYLEWFTAAELNNEGFEVERRMEGEGEFTTIGFKEGNGTTTNTSDYDFVDNEVLWSTSVAYYRLRQVDYDGNFAYSPIVVVTKKGAVDALVYPNPANKSATISIVSDAKNIESKLIVRDMFGAEVTTEVDVLKVNGAYTIDASVLRNGTYFMELLVNNQKVVKKLMVTR